MGDLGVENEIYKRGVKKKREPLTKNYQQRAVGGILFSHWWMLLVAETDLTVTGKIYPNDVSFDEWKTSRERVCLIIRDT